MPVTYRSGGRSTTLVPYLLGFILLDSNNVSWAVTIDDGGNLMTQEVIGVPPNSITLTAFLLQDSLLNTWSTTVDTQGHLITTPSMLSPTMVGNLQMIGESGRLWTVLVLPSGNLDTV
jgi:hypothetical protein